MAARKIILFLYVVALEISEIISQPEVTKKVLPRKERISRYQPVDSLTSGIHASEPKTKQRQKEKRQKNKIPEFSGFSDDENSTLKKSDLTAAAVARETQQLKQLEKQLKLKKSASLPRSFRDDGLDYLLDIVGADKLTVLSDSDSEESSSVHGSDDEQQEEMLTLPAKKKQKKAETNTSPGSQKKKVHFTDEINEDKTKTDDFKEEMESGDESSREDEDRLQVREDEMEDDAQSAEEEDEELNNNREVAGDEDEDIKEDIYGRLVDGKGVPLPVSSNSGQSTVYIPPARRAAMLGETGPNSVELVRLKKQMKGLLNRASESNMQSIANAVEDLYMRNSRAFVNESLFTLITEAVVSPVLTPTKLLAEMAMLVAILHGNVGSEVGAYFLQQAAKLFDEQRQQDLYGGEHILDNIILLLAYLYNFKVANHTLLFDIITLLVESFSEKDIELLLLVLKSSGFYLRRDDPEALGNLIISMQQKAQELRTGAAEVPARVRFMLEVLMAVRNNNVRRVPGADMEQTDHLRRVAGTYIRGGGLADNQLNIGLKDLLSADKTGRWWIVGSAWEGKKIEDSTRSRASAKASTTVSVIGEVSESLIRLAKKLRMNSDVRRSIFYTLMSSEDYLDAFQKVLQLGLKGQQEREIIVVCVECCKQEAKYNPFYTYLLEKLAKHERRFMMAMQFHFWDVFRAIGEMNTEGRQNVALMLAHLLASRALSLSVLKVLEFGALEKPVVKFMKLTMTKLLKSTNTSDLKEIFRRIGQQQKLLALSDGLRMFLTKHITMDKTKNQKTNSVSDKLAEVCSELSLKRQTVL